jgi:hypothetical protein
MAAAAPAQQPEAPEVRQAQIERALERGVAYLLEQQERSHRIGERALVLYAALQGGADPAHPAFASFTNSLDPAQFTQTYDTACVLCFLTSHDPAGNYPLIEQATAALLSFQESTGGFGYPGHEDMSNNQYAALGLWKASTVGVRIPAKAWEELTERVLELQGSSGGFGYRGPGGSSINMTTAGVGTLSACESALRLFGGMEDEQAETLREARARGMAWLEDRVPANTTRMRGWPRYGLYGLERLAAWGGLTKLGAHDWYQRGVQELVPRQSENGSWGGATDSAFAVLFLSRATSDDRPGVAVTSSGDGRENLAGVTRSEKSAESFAQLRVDGHGPSLQFGVEAWNWTALRPYEWKNERGRGPRVKRVEYLIDGEVVKVQLADQPGPLLNRRFKAKLWAYQRGPMQVSMRVHVELPPGKPKDADGNRLEPVLELGPLDVVALRALDRPAVGKRISIRDFTVARAVGSTGASSRLATAENPLPDDGRAVAAVDADLRSAWVARPADRKRLWNVRLTRKVHATRLTLYPATAPVHGEPLARPKLVEVILNGEERHAVVIPENQPGKLSLNPEVPIRRIELRIISLDQPEAGAEAPFGWAEVVLRAVGE